VLSDSAAQPAPLRRESATGATQAGDDLRRTLAHSSIPGEVILRDDGSAANGDDQAGDRIYSALIPADFEGTTTVA
jgi:hypothetical protein